ncbi:MAG: dTDP-glucose 4,6-dehydratase [Planctomycetes bacterium]|jgi:dTDP-glucose 4,6-dehydratase|nr:dTDP-glucose 4,6-dehydratase [Planctomycetota bacterium]MCP4839236.1 dTDP-glucose 4,6-dehydratase [Planctomycetota bacterium]
MSISTVLVTGGAGFIGSNYVRSIAQDHPKCTIRVLDLLTYSGNMANLADLEGRIEFTQGDIADPAVLDAVVPDCDTIINFAAESHVDRSLVDSRPFVHSNVLGVQVLLDACRRHDVRRFLQISTDEVYGDLGSTSRCSLESDPLRPRNPYAASKAAAEHLVQAAHASFGLNTVITRGSNTYGPWQYPEKIIPLFTTQAMEGLSLPVYGDGTAVRDYLHVDDHCAGIECVLHNGVSGGIYNLGARLQISGLDVADAILKHIGLSNDHLTFTDDRIGHDYRYEVDPSKAESLGWIRSRSWQEGLLSTIDWYQRHHDWWQAIRSKSRFGDFKAR